MTMISCDQCRAEVSYTPPPPDGAAFRVPVGPRHLIPSYAVQAGGGETAEGSGRLACWGVKTTRGRLHRRLFYFCRTAKRGFSSVHRLLWFHVGAYQSSVVLLSDPFSCRHQVNNRQEVQQEVGLITRCLLCWQTKPKSLVY